METQGSLLKGCVRPGVQELPGNERPGSRTWAHRNYREGLRSQECEPGASLQRTVEERRVMDEYGRNEGITGRGEDLCLGGRHGDQEDTQRDKKRIWRQRLWRTEEAFSQA